MTMCSGWPLEPMEINGWLISVWEAEDSSIFAFSAASFRRCKRHLVFGQVNECLFFELVREVVDDAHVKVFTAKERVAVGGFYFEQAVVDFEDGHVECTATKVIDRDGLRVLFCRGHKPARLLLAR